MSVARRIAALFHLRGARNRAEDPREVLDYSYQRQAELLAQMRRGVADVTTSRKRLELQATRLQASVDAMQAEARQALQDGREDLAREALTRRQAALAQLTDLQGQRDSLVGEEARLTLAAERLQAKVEAFRARKDAIKANYTAAEAQSRIGEALSGISEEMGDVGLAIQRAEDKTVEMQSRAAAVDELLASGVLDDISVPGARRDEVQAALDRQVAGISVDAELARMKGELPQQPQPAQLEPPPPAGATPAAEEK